MLETAFTRLTFRRLPILTGSVIHRHQCISIRPFLDRAITAWLGRTPSAHTRKACTNDLAQFLDAHGIAQGHWERLAHVRPEHVSAWRDALTARGQTNSTVRRKLTALRSLFSYLQTYGYAGAKPAHGDFVASPAVPRDGKTVGLSPAHCRALLESPTTDYPVGIRDRAMLAVLAYSACRVGEVVKIRVKDFKISGVHRVMNIFGKGGKERTCPVHAEAVEQLAAWIDQAGIRDDVDGALFRPALTSRGRGRDGFMARQRFRAAQWSVLIDEWNASGLNLTEFCQRRGHCSRPVASG